ncbi:gamma carbonic anhydrase family protein [Candidatus Mcinerneyibacteriota bacterium]|nr:gamma carbonic anhydrase family protein [Candidatus Mcinerneyibacteriota bacterium]
MLQYYKRSFPVIHSPAYIHPRSVLTGDVELGKYVNIWPGAVLRGDVNYIRIGEGTNIQDNAVVHVAHEFPALIGKNVTVGHGAILHACRIGDSCLIGMGATVLDGAEIGEYCIIGANALVPKGMVIPPGSLVLGMPAKVKRPLKEEERDFLNESAKHYWELAQEYKELGDA